MRVEKSDPLAQAFRKEEVRNLVSQFHWLDDVRTPFWKDKITTAGAIGMWLFGRPLARKVYHLAESSKTYPFFQEGTQIAIRKSVVRAHVWGQEREAFASEREEELVKLAVLLEKLSTFLWQRSDPLIQNSDPDAVQFCAVLLAETSKAVDRVLNG